MFENCLVVKETISISGFGFSLKYGETEKKYSPNFRYRIARGVEIILWNRIRIQI